jgi:hypothetical protein
MARLRALFWKAPRPARGGRKPGRAERRAAARTARAEAMLARTEQQIHELADDVRRDMRGRSSRG